jgi:carbonic anhydrase
MRILFGALVAITLTACSAKTVSRDSTKSPVPLQTTVAAETGKPLTDGKNINGTSLQQLAAKETEGMKVTLKPLAAKPSATPIAKKATERGPVAADKALGWLKNGNTRFTKHYLRNDGDLAKDRTRLVPGQKPHSIVLSCSDSRVPPEVVFDQKLGEIFVVRTAGESLDASTIASIEYALEHLGSNLIVVMGHESCGAVKAALATLDGSDAGSPWLNKLVQDLHPHLKSFKGKPVSEGALVEGWANLSGVAKDLVDRSQIVRDAVNSGEVKIQTALYHLGSGIVEFK